MRHGPTHERALTGWREVRADLSDRAALARLDAALPRGALLVSSDLGRAVATADALSAGRRRLPHRPDLREFDFGAWDGLTFEQVAADWPDLSRACWEHPGEAAPPGGESWNRVAERVTAAVAALGGAHPGAEIVVVAHMGTILTQLAAALALTPGEAIARAVDPLSLTRIRPGAPARVGPVNLRP